MGHAERAGLDRSKQHSHPQIILSMIFAMLSIAIRIMSIYVALQNGVGVPNDQVWSLAARHSCPPESYAEYFGEGLAERIVATMMNDAAAMYWLEELRISGDAWAKELWNDCHCAQSKPVRMIFAFFERDGAYSQAGSSLLRGCLQTVADNKGVEELHHACKLDAKAAPNKNSPPHRLQHCIIRSGVVERRDMKHSALVTKEYLHNYTHHG